MSNTTDKYRNSKAWRVLERAVSQLKWDGKIELKVSMDSDKQPEVNQL